jgi:UDP-N-acetylglucosamine 2-epimerase (non-hydrolysing)
MKKKILLVAGARPNFMKIAPLYRELNSSPADFNAVIVHTGQHYDEKMSALFFKDLDLPRPDIYLDVGSASHAVQTAKIMTRFELVVKKKNPDLVIVVGDVNSTVACSLVASKLLIPVAHVEAGLRSRDRTMPEEINRLVTDQLSDYLFTTSRDADKNLRAEGVPKTKIHFVGNTMIDSLKRLKGKAKRSKIRRELGLKKGSYTVLTLHRPSNVDDRQTLEEIFEALIKISNHLPIIFPAHPRTVKQMKQFKLALEGTNIRLIDPLGYLDFMKLYMDSRFVLTDSGGIQEETSYLRIPCITLRENTERPVTVTRGTNVLVGTSKRKIIRESMNVLDEKHKSGRVPELWDGMAARRIVKILKNLL